MFEVRTLHRTLGGSDVLVATFHFAPRAKADYGRYGLRFAPYIRTSVQCNPPLSITAV